MHWLVEFNPKLESVEELIFTETLNLNVDKYHELRASEKVAERIEC